MKKTFKTIFLSALAVVVTGSFTACSDDDFGESIFEIPSGNIDKTSYTAPLDSFVKKCFLIPYNVDFKYKMEDISSDVTKNLIPASYQKCKELAVLTKYLWYDVYRDNVENGEILMKKYSPRIIHLIGSKNVNPNTGTEILGETSNGIMITLFRGNTLDVNDMDYSNEYFFKTMHHEFGHMLCSNHVVPTDYRSLTPGVYDALSWQETSDSVALGQGCISQYSRNNYEDDFVELFCVFLTSTDQQWQARLNTSKWSWEEKEVMYDYWQKLRRATPAEGIDSIGYLKSISDKKDGKCTVIRKIIKRETVDADQESTVYAHAVTNEDGEIEYLGDGGYDYIEKKFDILKNYLQDYYDIDIYRLREAINKLTYYVDENGNFILDNYGRPKNRVKDILPQLLDDLENYNF